MDSELVNRLELHMKISVKGKKPINRRITFGCNGLTKTFDKRKMEAAFEQVKEKYGEKLGSMTNKMIKAITWDYYTRSNPFIYEPEMASLDKELISEPPLMKESVTLVNPFIENGSSALLLGGSNSGKTTLLVQALHNLLRDYKERYDLIIIFTGAHSSIPFENLPKCKKLLLFRQFLPPLVKFLMEVNMETDRRYSILIILDDIYALKHPVIDLLILVARNYGISTIVSTQKITGLSPSARDSMHNNYILGGRNPETRDEIIEKYMRGFLRDRGLKTRDEMDKWLRENTEVKDDERRLIKINAIKGIMSLHDIKK